MRPKQVLGLDLCVILLTPTAWNPSVSMAAETAAPDGLIAPDLIVNVGSSVPGILDMVKMDWVIDSASGNFGIRLEIPNQKYQLPGDFSAGSLTV